MRDATAIIEGEGLPASLHTERVILGAMLSDPIAVEDALLKLTVDDFSVDSHRRIYAAMQELNKRELDIDFVVLAELLQQRLELEAIGGRAYIISLTEGLPRHLAVGNYVQVVKDKAVLRGIIEGCDLGMRRAALQSDKAIDILNDLETKMQALGAETQKKQPSLQDACDEAFEELERRARGEVISFFPTGIEEYDRIGGYAKGETTVVAARPRVGKSSMLRQGVIANCVAGNFFHLFSPEMRRDAVLFTLWSSLARVFFNKVRHPERLTGQDWKHIRWARDAVKEWPLEINDTPEITAAEVIQSVRAIKRKHNTAVVGIDYLQKMRFPGKPAERHIAVTDAMISLTAMAKRESMALVMVSSLTEPSQKDRNRLPALEDLRMSGDIRYEANTVLMLHRDLDADTQKLTPETKLITAKARSDEDGMRTMYFHGQLQTFMSHNEYMGNLR